MKKYEIATMTNAELKKGIVELKKRIQDLKFDKAVEPLQNPMVLRNSRKDIARMMTRLNQIRKRSQ